MDEPLKKGTFLRYHLQIVFQDHSLPVEGEGIEPRVGAKDLQKVINRVDKPDSEFLEGDVPCPVPVRLRDDIGDVFAIAGGL